MLPLLLLLLPPQILWDLGFHVDTLHGDMDQNARTRIIGDFKTGKLRVLVATDVAARGLDVKDVTDVVNYDFPFGRNGVEDYVHRIGRTGRAGSTGTSHTFFDPAEDRKNAAGLIALLQGAQQPVPDALAALARGGGGKGRFGGGSGGGGGGGGRRGVWGGGGGGGGGHRRRGRQRVPWRPAVLIAVVLVHSTARTYANGAACVRVGASGWHWQ
jgi:ATP-dependent RNA helicase DDX5/DBP2